MPIAKFVFFNMDSPQAYTSSVGLSGLYLQGTIREKDGGRGGGTNETSLPPSLSLYKDKWENGEGRGDSTRTAFISSEFASASSQ